MRVINMMDGVLLAGGKSSRMGGKHKGDLQLHGRSFARRIADSLRPMVDTLWLSYGAVDRGELADCPIVHDVYPDCGAMGGIHAALKRSRKPWLLVAACDMPYLKSGVYRHLESLLDDGDIGIAATLEGRPQPLTAIYHKDMLPYFEAQLQSGDYRLRTALDTAGVRYVPLDDHPDLVRMLRNVNTVEEYAALIWEEEGILLKDK